MAEKLPNRGMDVEALKSAIENVVKEIEAALGTFKSELDKVMNSADGANARVLREKKKEAHLRQSVDNLEFGGYPKALVILLAGGIRTIEQLTAQTEGYFFALPDSDQTVVRYVKYRLYSKCDLLLKDVKDSQEEQNLCKLVSELGLSVRARKAMQRLGIQSVGELVTKSADDLRESKNFGETSLNEVRRALWNIKLSLHGEPVVHSA